MFWVNRFVILWALEKIGRISVYLREFNYILRALLEIDVKLYLYLHLLRQ